MRLKTKFPYAYAILKDIAIDDNTFPIASELLDRLSGGYMSKFIERLNEALRPSPAPMGFGRRAESKKKARILLVAALDAAYTQGLTEMVSGADAVLLPAGSVPGDGEAEVKAPSGIPCGEWLTANEGSRIDSLAKNGCDFIVFRADKIGLSVLQYEKMGKVLEVDPQMEDGLLRTVGTLPVDAIFIHHEGEGPSYFTWHDLMVFRHFADSVSKPIIVTVAAPLSEKELLVLWEAGVDAMVVPAGSGAAGDLLKNLRQKIDGVVFPAERRPSKREATVPALTPEAPKEEEEEDGDEEEDE